MTAAAESVVIAGAGHAAGELATSLRQQGWAGSIIMAGEETHLPYQRPPLSKGLLAGEAEIESLYLKPRETYEKANVEMLLGVRVERIDRASKSVSLSDGRTLTYTRLVLATGGRARHLSIPGSEGKPRNLHYLRTIDDVLRIRAQFREGARLVIVGGGYIGLEVAAVAIKRGLKVTLLEALPRVLARVTAPEISAFYETVHRAAGVDIRTGAMLEKLELDAEGSVAAVACTDGTRHPADLVIAGIGLVPDTGLAEAAGLAVDNGILVDEFCRTSDPDIFAAGDCANHMNGLAGRRLRLESVPNALEQARTAAACICGVMKPYDPVPWFWSDQYDLKLQMVGLSQGYDRFVLRGDPDKRSFSAFYLKQGMLIAADTVNRPQDFMIARRLVGRQRAIDPALLADEALPLKQFLD